MTLFLFVCQTALSNGNALTLSLLVLSLHLSDFRRAPTSLDQNIPLGKIPEFWKQK